jgi:hypothetical protein
VKIHDAVAKEPAANFLSGWEKSNSDFISGLAATRKLRWIFKIFPEISGRHTGCLSAGGY